MIHLPGQDRDLHYWRKLIDIITWKLSKARAGMLSSNCLMVSQGPSPTPTRTIDKGYSLHEIHHKLETRGYQQNETGFPSMKQYCYYLALTMASMVCCSCGVDPPFSVSTLLVTCHKKKANGNYINVWELSLLNPNRYRCKESLSSQIRFQHNSLYLSISDY